jgi:hypothetical protein
MENPEPTEDERAHEGTQRHIDEEDMRGVTPEQEGDSAPGDDGEGDDA